MQNLTRAFCLIALVLCSVVVADEALKVVDNSGAAIGINPAEFQAPESKDVFHKKCEFATKDKIV
jgi:hypothetical protein